MLRSRPLRLALVISVMGFELRAEDRAAPPRAMPPVSVSENLVERLPEAKSDAPVPPAMVPAPSSLSSSALPPSMPASTAGTAEPPAGSQPPKAAPVEPLPAAPPASAKPRAPAPLKIAAVSKDPQPTLDPGSFINTMRASEKYLAIAEAGGWPTLQTGTLKIGDRGEAVAKLKARLAVTGDLLPEDARGADFEARLLAAVKRFQARHGLPETGLVGAKTIEAANVPATTRFRQLAASAQRLVGSSFPFGERYVVVNIPSATVEAVEKGQVARRYVAVVGKKERASPSVETKITSVNVNPTWTVPVSIIKKDIIPHMRKDPGYLAKMNIRILDAQGREVEPQKIDWATEKAVNYTLRQDAGADNSLGQIRIDMPNRHAVYMHDTPTKRLFSEAARFHSSGCVRVADVKAFVGWLLEGTPAPSGPWTSTEIDAAIAAAKRQDIKLARAVPVSWVYMTGYATPDGTVHFRDDVYGLDTPAPTPPLAPAADVTVTSSLPARTSARATPQPRHAVR